MTKVKKREVRFFDSCFSFFNHGLFCAGLSSGVLAIGYVMCYKEEFKVKFSWLTFFLIPAVAMLGLFIGELLTEK